MKACLVKVAASTFCHVCSAVLLYSFSRFATCLLCIILLAICICINALPCLYGLVTATMCLQDDKEAKKLVEATNAAAKKNEKLKFLLVDSTANEQAVKYFSIEKKDLPAIVIQNAEDEKFIKGGAQAGDLAGFISKYTVRLRQSRPLEPSACRCWEPVLHCLGKPPSSVITVQVGEQSAESACGRFADLQRARLT